jgi:Flp pilus assembly protein CpaB
LVTHPPTRGRRPAAVQASTVFAIALAIVAGLIFAWLFKVVLLDKKQPPKPVDDSVPIAYTTTNLYDQTEIKSIHVKSVKVPRTTVEAWRKEGRQPLIGAQPVGRVTKVSVNAEEPIFADYLLPFNYPVPVTKLLRPGMRAVIVTIPATEAMVQVNDYVDLYLTLSNDFFGPGSNGTAEVARGCKVIARFGTTRPGAQPRNLDAPRQYTLEVTPYRFALIQLAKSVGATFSLAAAGVGVDEENRPIIAVNDLNDPRETAAQSVTGADLAALFGIGGPPPPPPAPYVIEKYVGINPAGSAAFPGYIPPSRGGALP